jgi:hypothetical protein
MPRVGFENTIPVFEWAKTVHALDRAATVIGPLFLYAQLTILFYYTSSALRVLQAPAKQLSFIYIT